PSFGETKEPLIKDVMDTLKTIGISRLFSHQAQGVDLIREGKNVVVMTPTASGKSLIYQIPILEFILDNPSTKAIYISPLKGLEQDQLKTFHELTKDLPIERGGEIYDGDTSGYRRKKIREHPPNLILTNPDMLHLAINAFHPKWEGFFRNLRFIIVDEIHTYRGVFGSHVAHVLRRLRRICNFYSSNPQFIACSATIANPGELAQTLSGLPFEVIDKSGAPMGGRHFLFLNPSTSTYTIATRLFIASVRAGFKTIAFTKARKITELMHTWVNDSASDIRDRISSYRAGFLPTERREIEERLFMGELEGVISTSALELGVDIGGLDVCILVGYPGTIASTWQRSGRVGRKGRDAVIILVALQDALDQYFMRHPEDFFRRSSEAAVLDPKNPVILKAHLPCASAEVYLRSDDRVYDVLNLMPTLDELEEERKINRGKRGDIWFSRGRYPQRLVGIREIGETFDIIEDDKPLGEASQSRVIYELHPGAIYLHHGRQYRVRELDMVEKKVFCHKVDVDYYTQPLTREETEIIETKTEKVVRGFKVHLGILRATETVRGYVRKHIYTQEKLSEHTLHLPPSIFTTVGIWMEIEKDIQTLINENGLDLPGSLHALEHAAIATLPLFALCDRSDLGGVSYPYNPQLKKPAIFIYDGHEGGVGLTERGYEMIEDWFHATLKLIMECPCEDGCPSCVQDPRCGNMNMPLDKRGVVEVLRGWLHTTNK
ncbi:MAG: DEAD/DEAH box helicase, partial [Deltaproteobacteria bacterium]|nr:DEAD/DEAH box helicase [Deltaproteobacteria bacterium]